LLASWESRRFKSGGSRFSVAKIYFSYINFAYPTEPFPRDYDFHNLPGGISSKFILGPQAETQTAGWSLSQELIVEMHDGKRSFYIYGIILYGDAFASNDKPNHVTMYCSRLQEVGSEMIDGELVPRNFGFVPCDSHNCVDEDCKREPQAGLKPAPHPVPPHPENTASPPIPK
jgi:hypothetical protein